MAALVRDCEANGPGLTRKELGGDSGRRALQQLCRNSRGWARVFDTVKGGGRGKRSRYRLRRQTA